MESEQYYRKLIAVLYADVVGSSRLTGEDEAGRERNASDPPSIWAIVGPGV